MTGLSQEQLAEWKRLAEILRLQGEPECPKPPPGARYTVYGDSWFEGEAVPALEAAFPQLIAEVERLTEELRKARAAGMPTWPPSR